MKKVAISILFLVFNLTTVSAQYDIDFPKWYPETKFNALYVMCGDTTNEYVNTISDLVKKNWTLTPVYLIQRTDIAKREDLFVKGNLFLSVTSYNKTLTNSRGNVGSTNDYFHLDIWSVKSEYKPGREWQELAFIIASAELYNKTIGMGQISLESMGDFTSELFPNDFCNGKAGNIKNMIQYFNSAVKQNKTVKLLEDLETASSIAKLKKETLYLPNYWYGAKGTMIENEKPTSSDYKKTAEYIDKVVASYHYNIKLVTREELNDLILNADKDLFYVNYIQSSADKIVSVVNGLNGEVIYSKSTKKSYRIKNGDLEDIAKAVDK